MEMSGRKGSSGHQNLIRMASKKLLNEIIGDEYLSITMVRENPLDVKTQTEIRGERLGGHRVAMADLRMYADIACAVVFDPKASIGREPIFPHLLEQAYKALDAGDRAKYYNLVRRAYGVIIYIIECEINPRSHLLRDGPRLTAYKLIKQQNTNLRLILAVFEGTKIDNPQIFDEVWYFPRKGDGVKSATKRN